MIFQNSTTPHLFQILNDFFLGFTFKFRSNETVAKSFLSGLTSHPVILLEWAFMRAVLKVTAKKIKSEDDKAVQNFLCKLYI